MTGKRPERRKPFRSFIISGKAEKLVPTVLVFLVLLTSELLRPLWFDEALTVLNFALLESPEKIYHSYIIPNNQIIHTIFLHWWIKLFSFDLLRIFPLLCSLTSVILLWQLRKKSGNAATFFAIAGFIASFPFAVYGSALRGYMLAAAAVSGGVWMVTRYFECGRKRFLAGWFIFSLLGVGTMPGTLAGLAGALLYALGFCRWDILKNRRFYLAALTPPAAFLLFYLPIWKNLLRCAALGEGWHNGSAMLLALAMGIVFAFLPILIPAAFGMIKKHRFTPGIFHLLIWLLPVPAAYVFKVAPFPRVFFPLFPIFTLLLARGIQSFLALMRRKRGRKYTEAMLTFILLAIILWFDLSRFEPLRAKLSSLHPCPGGQDDFIDCHFVKKNFIPRETAAEFKKNFPELPSVYVSFASDPWALMYAFMENGVNCRILFDGPAGKVQGIPPVVIKHSAENPRALEERFHCRFQEVFSTPNHTVMVLSNE